MNIFKINNYNLEKKNIFLSSAYKYFNTFLNKE